MACASTGSFAEQTIWLRLYALAGEWLAPLLVVGAVLFNAVLAFVNAHAFPLSSGMVIAMEVLIVGAAGGWAVLHLRPEMKPWIALAVFAVGFGLVRMGAMEDFNPKFIRDMLLPATFVMLGITASPRSATLAIVIIQIAMLIGVVWEAAALDSFSQFFNPKEYYIATRGLSFDEFTNADSDLYISATRPEERFFPFFELHRISSLFIEPVSLGNYVVTVTAFIAAFWRSLGGWTRAFLILTNFLFLIACDGRFAFISSLLVVGSICFLPRAVQRVVPPFLLPVVTGCVMLLSGLPELQSSADDFAGRIGWTVRMLEGMGIEDWIGLSDQYLEASVDSGIVYLIITQSIFGVALYWAIVSMQAGASAAFRRYRLAICLTLAVGLLVSNAFVGIKTAAPMWFLFGVGLAMRGDEDDGVNRSGYGREAHA